MHYEYVGLGDLIHSIASRLGIQYWPGCGCEIRRQRYNRVKVPVLVMGEKNSLEE